MDSLPPPSEIVEDEWASMQIRFKKEGLAWEGLGMEERLLQVWRWMSDSETNLRTLRIKWEKFTVEHQVEQKNIETSIGENKKEKERLEEKLSECQGSIHLLTEKNKELEEDNVNLAVNLRAALRGSHSDTRVDSLLDQCQALKEQQLQRKLVYTQHINSIRTNQQTQVERMHIQIEQLKHETTRLTESLSIKEAINVKYKEELEKLYQERKGLAQKSIMKEEQMSRSIREGQEAEEQVQLLNKQLQDLVRENMKLKYG